MKFNIILNQKKDWIKSTMRSSVREECLMENKTRVQQRSVQGYAYWEKSQNQIILKTERTCASVMVSLKRGMHLNTRNDCMRVTSVDIFLNVIAETALAWYDQILKVECNGAFPHINRVLHLHQLKNHNNNCLLHTEHR